MTRRTQPEYELQCAIVTCLRARGIFVAHVPNGSKLGGAHPERTGTRLKKAGLVPGFPDLILIGKSGSTGFIEVKSEGAYQHPAQKACQAELERRGQRYVVCRSLADVDETLAQWGWL